MKKLLLLAIVISTIAMGMTSCMSYQTLSVDKPYVYTMTYHGQSKDKLFLKANDWMVSAFNNAESVIQYTDKEEGVIMGKYLVKGTISYSKYGTYDSRLYAKINLFIKDEAVKITIKPMGSWYYYENGVNDSHISLADMEHKADNLVASLDGALNGSIGFD